MSTLLAEHLLSWYAQHKRELPWRAQRDPYAVFVSEFMLQQTRIETVIPYYQRWMARFPNLNALAAASEEEVLKTWEGLGYYQRARSLHKAAQQIVREHAGVIPAGKEALLKLPGIGEYTAGAIASIAFNLDETAIDGNIRRVFSRLLDLAAPVRSPQAEQTLGTFAQENLPAGRAGDFNQALMDLGATICTSRTPNCTVCPLKKLCKAYQAGTQEDRPVMIKRPAIPHYIVTAAILQRDEKILLAQRPSNGLLGGMWEFPGGKQKSGESLPACLEREIMEELGAAILVGNSFGVYKHAYTHYKVTLHAFFCSLLSGEPQALEASQIRWVTIDELSTYPMGKIDRQIARQLTDHR